MNKVIENCRNSMSAITQLISRNSGPVQTLNFSCTFELGLRNHISYFKSEDIAQHVVFNIVKSKYFTVS